MRVESRIARSLSSGARSRDPLAPSGLRTTALFAFAARTYIAKKKPAVICDGRLFGTQANFLRPLRTLRLQNLMDGRGVRRRLRDDVGGDAADAGAGQADRAGSAGGQIQHPAPDERTSVVDGDDDALAAMGDAQLGAERQGAVGRRHGVGVHALAGSGSAAGFTAVEGRHAGATVP